MKILIACEFSGTVRDAFKNRGHDAWSCDLLPTETSGNHIVGDCLVQLKIENSYFLDFLGAHPTCTFLCNSGVRWLAPGGVINQERYEKMKEACHLFAALYHAKVPKVYIENPVMHGYASDYLLTLGVPRFTQSIQPWQFGHGETKRTCLWLRGLPPLVPTKIVSGREARVHHATPGPERWKERSRTLPGIALAMADQWGNL
jgi:hypothetical protein